MRWKFPMFIIWNKLKACLQRTPSYLYIVQPQLILIFDEQSCYTPRRNLGKISADVAKKKKSKKIEAMKGPIN